MSTEARLAKGGVEISAVPPYVSFGFLSTNLTLLDRIYMYLPGRDPLLIFVAAQHTKPRMLCGVVVPSHEEAGGYVELASTVPKMLATTLPEQS